VGKKERRKKIPKCKKIKKKTIFVQGRKKIHTAQKFVPDENSPITVLMVNPLFI